MSLHTQQVPPEDVFPLLTFYHFVTLLLNGLCPQLLLVYDTTTCSLTLKETVKHYLRQESDLSTYLDLLKKGYVSKEYWEWDKASASMFYKMSEQIVHGYQIGVYYIGSADDLSLLCTTMYDLQKMFNICGEFCIKYSIKKKSISIKIGSNTWVSYIWYSCWPATNINNWLLLLPFLKEITRQDYVQIWL